MHFEPASYHPRSLEKKTKEIKRANLEEFKSFLDFTAMNFRDERRHKIDSPVTGRWVPTSKVLAEKKFIIPFPSVGMFLSGDAREHHGQGFKCCACSVRMARAGSLVCPTARTITEKGLVLHMQSKLLGATSVMGGLRLGPCAGGCWGLGPPQYYQHMVAGPLRADGQWLDPSGLSSTRSRQDYVCFTKAALFRR